MEKLTYKQVCTLQFVAGTGTIVSMGGIVGTITGIRCRDFALRSVRVVGRKLDGSVFVEDRECDSPAICLALT